MRSQSIQKWSLRAVLMLVTVAIVAFLLVISHVHRIYGGYVKKADHVQFQTDAVLTAITNVSVLSPDGDAMLSDRTVVLDQGHIISVSNAGPVPEGALEVDGSGQFLIPGLIDSHVHIRRQPNDLLLYAANGVTHIRDLGGSKATLALREEVENGRIGPRIYAASPILHTADLVKGWYSALTEPRLNVGNADRAEAVVKKLVDDGYDALKTYADMDMDTYRAVNRSAKVIGIHTVGHLPDGFELEELRITEQRELAHIEEIVKVLRTEYAVQKSGGSNGEFLRYVEGRADEIIDAILANDITVNSVVWFMEILGKQAVQLENQLKQTPLEYANPAMVEGSPYAPMGWLPGRNKFELPNDASADERAAIETAWEVYAEANRILLRRMVERGVRIIAGTDATVNLVVPGFSLHNELESLVRNGMSPAQSLRAATATPSTLMNSNAGVVEPGRRADLLLLSANPLDDINNTTAIEAVVLAGRVLDRKKLDSMLEAVKRANAVSRNFDLGAYQ